MINLLEDYKPLFYEKPETRYYLITGGRGSGKSWTLALFLLNLTYQKGHVILFTRYTLVSAFISIIPEFLDKIEIMGKVNDFEVTQSEIINKLTGSKILFRGIKTSSGVNTANLKSIAGLSFVCHQIAAVRFLLLLRLSPLRIRSQYSLRSTV